MPMPDGFVGNKKRDEIYIYFECILDKACVPDPSAFSFKVRDNYSSNIDENVKVLNVEIENIPNKYYDISYVKFKLDKSLEGDEVYACYTCPENGMCLQDSSGTKCVSFHQYEVGPIQKTDVGIKQALISSDYRYLKIKLPIYTSSDDDLGKMEVYIDDEKIGQEQIFQQFYGNGPILYSWIYVQRTDENITKPSKIEVKVEDGKKVYSAAFEEVTNMSTEEIEVEEEPTFYDPVYIAETGKLMIKYTGAALFVDEGCQFVLKVGDQEYRLRGYGYHEQINQDSYLVFTNINLKHINLPSGSSFEIKYEPMITEYTSPYHKTEAGKPIDPTDYMEVTVQ